jgi:hypothetical protein
VRHFASLIFGLLPALSLAQVVINPTGGTTASNGIRLTIGNTGQLQVLRLGSGQLYNPNLAPGATTNSSMTNGVFLAVGNTVVGPQNFATVAGTGVTLQEWTPVSNTLTPQGSGGTATTALRATVGGRTYDLTVTWQYVFPNDFVQVTHSLTVPSGNPATIRLYHAFDAYLGGDDFGPSFFSLGPPALVGGYRPASNIVEAWRFRGGIPWTGYFAGFYACLFRESACPVGQNNSINSAVTFTNYVEPTTVDNSFGIMWNFGTAPGTYVTQNDLTFYSFQPQLSKRFGTTVINAGESTTLTFTIDNVPGNLAQSNLGFTDTFPTGLVLANGTVTNTCGGSVTSAGGGALAAGGTSVRLASGTLPSGTSRCTLAVNVTSSTAGAYVNGKTNISGVSVLENQVTDQTLSVVQGAPVVRLNAPGTINASNANAYLVSGTCQDTNGVVTVRVGSITVTTPCSSNTFSRTVNVASLADGANIIVSASQTNAAGTGTDSALTLKDTVAPSTPGFTSPAAGAFLNTATPTLTGTGEPGSTVRVFAGGVEICSAVVPPSGNWSCLTSTLADGEVTLTARATDPAGNTGATSPGRSITIDTMAPAAPVITNPANGATVAPNPSISGTSEPLATVVVTAGMTQLCSTPATSTGQWSCPTTLGIGSHSVTARQTDRAGNTGPASAARNFTIANVPTVSIDTPGPINAANVTAYTVAGNCTTGASVVTVTVGSVSTTTTCSAGRFSTSVNASSLPDSATVVLTASQTNATGTGSDTRNTLKDTVAPATPAITTPGEGSFINTTTPTFTGTGAPGSTVRVSQGATELCSTVVPASGQWACTSSPLVPGVIVVTARATDAADNTSPVSPQRSFTIDTTPPAAPVISAPAMNASVATNPTISGTAEPFATVTVFQGGALVCSAVADAAGAWSCPTSLGTGPHTIVARQSDRAGNVSPDSSPRSFTVEGLPNVLLNTPADIFSGNAAAYVVSGACTSTAGNVTVTVGTVSTMVPCAGGTFSATLDVRALADATMVVVRASQTTAAGTGSDVRTVKKDATAPMGTLVTDPKANHTFTSNTPTFNGTAEPGATVTIFVNGNPVGTTIADNTGAWTFTPSTPIADGQYVVTASARDAAGNEGGASPAVPFGIDSVAPNAPVLINPVAATTHDADRPLDITGVAEPNSRVTVYIDGVAVGTVTTDATGRFVLPLEPGALTAGEHVVEAEARDAAGNVSPRSVAVRFSVRAIEERFAGAGLIGCTAVGGLEGLGALAMLMLLRRREAR